MHIIYSYLPKVLSDMVLDYIYKPDIEKLNKEYKFKIEIFYYRDTYYRLYYNLGNYSKIDMNWRHLGYGFIYKHISNMYNGHIGIIPYNYTYTSGCNYLHGYK